MLLDSQNRRVRYLRLSLTKACALRCTYCRPGFLEHPADEPLLTPAEIEDLVRHLVEHHGLYKVRLTGGDPTSRPELPEIIERIARVPGITDLAMTTHGLTLARRARQYADAGLERVNISLDTRDPERFARLTGVNGLARVLEGIDSAEAAGLWPIRLNAVVVKGHNEQDLPDLAYFAAERGLEVRFIELMPMGPLADQWKDRYVPEREMHRILDAHARSWAPIEQGHDAARRYRIALAEGGEAVVGFITPMSCNFCAACNRIRVAADGRLYPCLMDRPAGTLLPALRPALDPRRLDEVLGLGLAGKREEHPHDGVVVMTHIGG